MKFSIFMGNTSLSNALSLDWLRLALCSSSAVTISSGADVPSSSGAGAPALTPLTRFCSCTSARHKGQLKGSSLPEQLSNRAPMHSLQGRSVTCFSAIVFALAALSFGWLELTPLNRFCLCTSAWHEEQLRGSSLPEQLSNKAPMHFLHDSSLL